jgi:hypothetical protein
MTFQLLREFGSPSARSHAWPILNQQELSTPLSRQTPSISLPSKRNPAFEGVSVSESLSNSDEVVVKDVRGRLGFNELLGQKKRGRVSSIPDG